MNGDGFLEPESMYSIMAWHFPFCCFFNVVMGKSMCISAFRPSSGPSNSFVMLLVHSAFCYVLLVAIF